MRGALLLLITALPFSTGCSAFIAGAGKDLSGLQTREQVHAEFGAPVATGTVEGRGYEDFRTRRKIAGEMRAHTCKLAAGMTFGASEVIVLPAELSTVMLGTIGGQTLRFWYDPTGRVTAVSLNGYDLHLHRPQLSGLAIPDSENEQTQPPQQP